MRIRSLSVAVLAGLVLVPLGAVSASAAETTSGPAAGVTKTFKSSGAQRAKRAAWVASSTVTRTVTTAPAPGPSATATYSDRVLALTNAERTRRGLRALSFSSCADGYANTWAKALSLAGSLSHQPLSPILTACRARGVGENVAFGNVTPEQLVAMWMGSPAHRANILNAGFTHLGVGDVATSSGRVYGVQVFLTL